MIGDIWGVVRNNFPDLASGFLVTVRIVAVSFVVAMAVGTVVAALRVAPLKPLKWIGGIFVESFRNVPLLVLIFIFFAGLRRGGIDIGAWLAGTLALGLYTAAYVAEAIRSGVFAVGRGQIEAALSLGFTYPGAMRRIVIPQAVRTVIPPLGNLVIAMIKNSAILGGSILALDDLLKWGRIIQNRNALTLETFTWVAVGYLILTISATVVVRRLETRLAIKR